MNRGVAVELDSFRLADYSSQIPCLICDKGNTLDAEVCRNCFAPMVLAHQAQSRHAAPLMIATLGPSGVGKTVYLGMLLDMLSRQPKELQMSARGGFSVTLQQLTLAALANCEFPNKTPSEPDRWNWVHCQLRSPRHRQPVELVMPDIAGEALFAEVDHPRSCQVIHSFLGRCHGVMILIDGTKLQSGSLDEDYFAMKLMSHLSELGQDPKAPWGNRPIALIFSKADQCESCFDDPAGYAQRHAPGLYRVCQQRFRKHKFFAAGVAGACVKRRRPGEGEQSVPLRIEPRGIIEPFEWLIENVVGENSRARLANGAGPIPRWSNTRKQHLRIEQAIFTSAQTDRAAGYQLVSRSPGVSEADACELAVWGPSHDSLLETKSEPSSTNFHRLASGAYAISRTTTAGPEYSGRGGARVYTQFLIVPPESLARFANNPFAVVRAATASGALCVLKEIPPELEPICLNGRAPAVDGALLAQLACRPGPAPMATLVQTALSSDQLGVATSTAPDLLIAGLVNLLPIECRPEFSFSTGLKFSPSRPFRVFALPADVAAWRAIGRHGVTLLNLDGDESLVDLPWEDWAGRVEEILKDGRISWFAAQLERRRPTLSTGELANLAQELKSASRPVVSQRVGGRDDSPPPVAEAAVEVSAETNHARADAAHTRPTKAHEGFVAPARPQSIDRMFETLAAQPAEVLEVLERIDDLVFAAISGDQAALTELQVLWPRATSELPAEVVEQSREQYLRCALSIWSQAGEVHDKQPERAISAIDVLCVLFDE